MANTSRPDILDANYRLSDGCTGLQIIDSLRLRFGMQLQAIIITGATAPKRIREAQKIDALLLHKPVNPNKLQQSVITLCAAIMQHTSA